MSDLDYEDPTQVDGGANGGCGITDTMARIVPVGGLWGTADGYPIQWRLGAGLHRADAYSCDGEYCSIVATPANTTGDGDPYIELPVTFDTATAKEVTFQFRVLQDFGIGSDGEPQLYLLPLDRTIAHGFYLDLFRSLSDQYLLVGAPTAAGNVTGLPDTDSGFRYLLGLTMNVRLELLGRRIRGKVWAEADAEPADWMVADGDPAGAPITVTTLYFFVPNTGTTLSVKNLDITGVNSCAVPWEPFDRPDQADWGTTPGGVDWTNTGQAQIRTNVGVLKPNVIGIPLSLSRGAIDSPDGAQPWDGNDVTLMMRFRFLTVPSVSPESILIIFQAPSLGSGSAQIEITPAAAGGGVLAWSGSGSPLIGTNAAQSVVPFTVAQWYRIDIRNTRRLDNRIRVWLWADGTTKPTTPTVNTTLAAGSTASGLFELDDLMLLASTSQEVEFDWIDWITDGVAASGGSSSGGGGTGEVPDTSDVIGTAWSS